MDGVCWVFTACLFDIHCKAGEGGKPLQVESSCVNSAKQDIHLLHLFWEYRNTSGSTCCEWWSASETLGIAMIAARKASRWLIEDDGVMNIASSRRNDAAKTMVKMRSTRLCDIRLNVRKRSTCSNQSHGRRDSGDGLLQVLHHGSTKPMKWKPSHMAGVVGMSGEGYCLITALLLPTSFVLVNHYWLDSNLLIKSYICMYIYTYIHTMCGPPPAHFCLSLSLSLYLNLSFSLSISLSRSLSLLHTLLSTYLTRSLPWTATWSAADVAAL